MRDLNRRGVIGLAGGAALWSFSARAQYSGKLRSIGYLGANTPASMSQWTAAFVQRLRELGWTEGRNLAIEYRWAEGRLDRSPALIAELVKLKVDVIVTHATLNVIAAKQATSVIPIVFAAVSDPVGNDVVASLARPGGNVTGLSAQISDVAGKRLELLQEIVPGLRRLAIMANLDNPSHALETREVQAAAQALGLEAAMSDLRRTDDVASVIEVLKGHADAIYVQVDPLFTTNRIRLNSLALDAGLPTMHGTREHVAAGGLISYGASIADMFRRAGDLVDKILRGTKPADIPVEQPTKFELAVNLKTARALGLNVPRTLVVLADEVIE
jgi:putative ABC transport system substrate-binding protein